MEFSSSSEDESNEQKASLQETIAAFRQGLLQKLEAEPVKIPVADRLSFIGYLVQGEVTSLFEYGHGNLDHTRIFANSLLSVLESPLPELEELYQQYQQHKRLRPRPSLQEQLFHAN